MTAAGSWETTLETAHDLGAPLSPGNGSNRRSRRRPKAALVFLACCLGGALLVSGGAYGSQGVGTNGGKAKGKRFHEYNGSYVGVCVDPGNAAVCGPFGSVDRVQFGLRNGIISGPSVEDNSGTHTQCTADAGGDDTYFTDPSFKVKVKNNRHFSVNLPLQTVGTDTAYEGFVVTGTITGTITGRLLKDKGKKGKPGSSGAHFVVGHATLDNSNYHDENGNPYMCHTSMDFRSGQTNG